MDARLVGWARAVKVRRRGAGPPPLWLFTDAGRMPCLRRVIAGLPRGLCGVVFRHDGAADRAGLGRAAARQCRAAGIPMVVSGDAGLAWQLRAGLHLRGGRRLPARRRTGWLTSSAHGMAELVRADRAGADVVFLSPLFATGSHPGAMPLSAVRWAALAGCCRAAPYALGGVSGWTARRIPRRAGGAGAIGALLR